MNAQFSVLILFLADGNTEIHRAFLEFLPLKVFQAEGAT